MTDHTKVQNADPAETPPGNADDHKFGDLSEQNEKQVIAEEKAAEQLGNFA